MSVANVSANVYPSQAGWQANAAQFRQTFQQLGSSLQSGDLSSAQQAFASLQDLQPANASNKSNLTSGPLASDWNTLSQALQSGDVKAAQAAFSQLQTDMKASHKGHHHHHSQDASAAAPSSAQQSTSPDQDGDNDGSVQGSNGVVA